MALRCLIVSKLVNQSQTRHAHMWPQQSAGSDYCVCTDFAAITNKGTEFVDPRFYYMIFMADFYIGAVKLVTIVGNDRPGFDIYCFANQ